MSTGTAKTNAFMLGTATVMVGPQADLFRFTPDQHSIGLVKNCRITAQPSYRELTQGVKSTIVYSVMTGNVVKASMEVFEYTAANLAYALGLDGSTLQASPSATTITTATTVDATSITVASAAGLSVGNSIIIQDGEHDNVVVRRINTIASNTITFSPGLPRALPVGTTVRRANVISIGSKTEQPFLAAKIVGTIADGTEMVILCPKIRITNGFSLGFTNEDFDNMPFEFSFYDLVSTDPHFTEFRHEQAKLYTVK